MYARRMSDFAPASTNLRPTIFWDVTQRALVVTNISEPPIAPHPETSVTNYQLCYVTSWDTDGIANTAAEVWNLPKHGRLISYSVLWIYLLNNTFNIVHYAEWISEFNENLFEVVGGL
jgi:hypothetical protein